MQTPPKLPLIMLCLMYLSSCQTPTDNPQHTTMDSSTTQSYSEQHRPQFHFSPPAHWMNDPNGMVYYEGEYHLFYQHYPDSTVWGPMHWGHAVSKDLVHWENLPIALYPDSLGYIFSGSAVIDWNNSSGFGKGNTPPMVAVYTYHRMEGEKSGRKDYQTQGIAYSLDKGRSWTKYAQNPVLPNPRIKDFRDPKVFRYEESQNWVMILAAGDRVKIYTSPDLKSWTLASEFGESVGNHKGVWECPDLFKRKVEGSDMEKWVLLVSINPGGIQGGSATQYFVGDFDGKKFTLDQNIADYLAKQPNTDSLTEPALWLDYGTDNYAGVTWSDIPQADGRRIFLGWMSNWAYAQNVPTDTWRSAMTIPRSLHLIKIGQIFRLASRPVEELKKLRKKSFEIPGKTLKGTKKLDVPFPITPSEITLSLDMKQSQNFEIVLSNTKNQKLLFGFDRMQNKFYVDRSLSGKKDFSGVFARKHFATRFSQNDTLYLQVFIDAASIEIFADQGQVVMTEIFFPDSDFQELSLNAQGEVKLTKGIIYQLQGIWK